MRSGVLVASVVVAMAGSAAAQPNEAPPVRPPGLTQPMQPATTMPAPTPSSSAPSIPAMPPPNAAPAWRSDGAPSYGRQRGEVDENLAVTLPLIATTLSWVAMIGGVESRNGSLGLAGALGTLMAPSMGRWYAGESSAAGLGMRLTGAATIFVVALSAIGDDEGCDFDEPCSNHDNTKLEAALLAGVGLYISGTIYDLATSGSAARDHNRRLRGVTLAPVVHGDSRGLALTGRF